MTQKCHVRSIFAQFSLFFADLGQEAPDGQPFHPDVDAGAARRQVFQRRRQGERQRREGHLHLSRTDFHHPAG